MPRPAPNTKHTLRASSAYIFTIRALPALTGLLVLVAFSRYTDARFYGFYQKFWIQLQVYQAIGCLGIPALLLTYPIGKLQPLINTVSRKGRLLLAGWVLAMGALFACFQFPASGLFYFFFPVLFLALYVLVAVCEAYLMVGGRFRSVAWASAAYAVFFGAVHVLFLRHRLSLEVLFLLLLAGILVRGLLLLLQAVRLYRATGDPEAAVAPKGFRSFWFHLGLYDVIQTVFRWADKFILSFLLSKELFAVYVNGTVDIPFLALMLGAVGSALLLHLSAGTTTDEDRIRLLRQSSAKLALVVFPLFSFFVFFRHELFSVVFTRRYSAAVPLFLISSLTIPLRAYNFTSILQHKAKGKIINTGALLDLGVALVLMYPLYLLWALNGVALAFVISTYFQAWFYLWHTARILHCPIPHLLPLKSWLRTGTGSLLLFFIGHYLMIRCFNPYCTLFLGCCLMGMILSVIFLYQFVLKRNRHGGQI